MLKVVRLSLLRLGQVIICFLCEIFFQIFFVSTINFKVFSFFSDLSFDSTWEKQNSSSDLDIKNWTTTTASTTETTATTATTAKEMAIDPNTKPTNESFGKTVLMSKLVLKIKN